MPMTIQSSCRIPHHSFAEVEIQVFADGRWGEWSYLGDEPAWARTCPGRRWHGALSGSLEQ